MSHKRQRIGPYVRASEADETRHWLDAFAKNTLGLAKFVRPEPGDGVLTMDLDDTFRPGDAAFTNVVVGHWIMAKLLASKRTNVVSYLCVSRCGVVAMYTPAEVAAGKLPKSCYGCRPGEHSPPSTRCLPESQLPLLNTFWETPMPTLEVQENPALRGKDSHAAWMTQGRELLCLVADATGLGKHFGWKAAVHSATPKPQKKSNKDRCRFYATHLKERRVELVMQPAGCSFEFVAFLSTPRTDYEFANIAERVKEAVLKVCTPDVKDAVVKCKMVDDVLAAAATPSGPPAAAESNGHHSVVDLGAIDGLMERLATVKRVGKDLNDVAAQKALCEKRVQETRAEKLDAFADMVTADEAMKAARVRVDTYQDRVREMETKLRNEVAARDGATESHAAAAAAIDAARSVYDPLAAAATAAERDLQEILDLEAESLKAVGDVNSLRALLQALGQVKG